MRGIDTLGREVLSLVEGETVGDAEPWPAWTHTEGALDDIGRWLRAYHAAVADFRPSADATWRDGGSWAPGLIIGHGDPAPYNAVWDAQGLVGLIDWDDAGPVHPSDDLAWVAFSWTPLHARSVVLREGFTDLGRRRERLERILEAYGRPGATAEILERIDARLTVQVRSMRVAAAAGDRVRARMVAERLDELLEEAQAGLAEL